MSFTAHGKIAPPQAFISSYAPRLRSYGNSLISPIVPPSNTLPPPRTTKRGTTAINYAEDGYDDDDFEDSEGPRRATGLRSVRRDDSTIHCGEVSGLKLARVESCRSVNDEPTHWLAVLELHRDLYFNNTLGPFTIPAPRPRPAPPRIPTGHTTQTDNTMAYGSTTASATSTAFEPQTPSTSSACSADTPSSRYSDPQVCPLRNTSHASANNPPVSPASASTVHGHLARRLDTSAHPRSLYTSAQHRPPGPTRTATLPKVFHRPPAYPLQVRRERLPG